MRLLVLALVAAHYGPPPEVTTGACIPFGGREPDWREFEGAVGKSPCLQHHRTQLAEASESTMSVSRCVSIHAQNWV